MIDVTMADQASARNVDAATLHTLRSARIGRLATVGHANRPSVVPICFAVVERAGAAFVVSALDEKPKRVGPTSLTRVRNIQSHPDVMLVVDEYAEDWSRLWFVQARGRAAVVMPGDDDHAAAVAELRRKYAQYSRMDLESRPVIEIEVSSAHAWSGASSDPEGLHNHRGGAELDEIVRGRRSVRSFLSRPVPRAVIEEAISAAGWAPSPHGRQPWRFAVVEAASRRAALATAMAASWEEQLRFDGQETEVMTRRLARSQDRLREAPLLVVPCLYLADLDVYPDADRQEAERIMAIQSVGAAIQNFLLTIYAAGLDAGWMCAPLFCPEVVQEALGLTAALIPQALIPVGYAANDPVRRERLPLASLITSWE